MLATHTKQSIRMLSVLLGMTCLLIQSVPATADSSQGRSDDLKVFHSPHKNKPLVIGHRGAAGYRPEHTLASYQRAIELGADFVEPDLVVTKDGVLITRHEPVLAQVMLNASNQIVLNGQGNPTVISETTNVATKPEFKNRLTVKMLDGVATGGWFAEDFTLAEIKTLRARERIPAVRPANTAFNDQFEIPTLVEVIQLVKNAEKGPNGRNVGIYPETKHPTYFAKDGKFLDGTPINQSLGKLLIKTLVEQKFADKNRVFIQSFEFANLIELETDIMPKANVKLPLVQLYSGLTTQPYDMRYNGLHGEDPVKIYGPLNTVVPGGITSTTTYGDFTSALAFMTMAQLYADGIGPAKESFLLRAPISPPVDANGDGIAQVTTKLTGAVHPFLANAQQAGLVVHPYTLRAEEPFLTLNPDGTPQTVIEEAIQLLNLGINGFFIDQADKGVEARDEFLATH